MGNLNRKYTIEWRNDPPCSDRQSRAAKWLLNHRANGLSVSGFLSEKGRSVANSKGYAWSSHREVSGVSSIVRNSLLSGKKSERGAIYSNWANLISRLANSI